MPLTFFALSDHLVPQELPVNSGSDPWDIFTARAFSVRFAFALTKLFYFFSLLRINRLQLCKSLYLLCSTLITFTGINNL